MKPKLTSELRPQHDSTQQEKSASLPAREFASVDELLRYDAAHTEVPPVIAERLEASIGAAARENRSWWQRIFGDSNR